MAKTTNLNIRIDPDTKAGAEKLFRRFGITISDAVNIFLHQSLIVGGLPFEVREPQYNAQTEAAMKEAMDLANGKIPAKSYSNVSELFAALDAEPDTE